MDRIQHLEEQIFSLENEKNKLLQEIDSLRKQLHELQDDTLISNNKIKSLEVKLELLDKKMRAQDVTNKQKITEIETEARNKSKTQMIKPLY